MAAPAGAAVLAFDERDGVTGRICIRGAAFRSRGGELYFGTSRGLTRFQPEGFQTNTRVPPVVLTGLRLANRPVSAGRPGSPLSGPIEETTELVLSHDQADVTFTFAALNYILPQKNRYTHRLEGLDRDWSPVGPETSASYVRIPPGDYVFRVRACNNDGVWNMDGVRLRLRVRPPFWQTGWFVAAVAVSIVGIGALLHASRLRRVRQRFLAVLGERRRLSRELHDTLEQGLAGIALQVDSARQHLARRPEVVARCLDTALHMVEYSREETRRTVNQLRSQALERGDIAQAVREVAGELTSGGRPSGGGRGARCAAPALGRRRAPPVPHRAGGADQRREARAGLPRDASRWRSRATWWSWPCPTTGEASRPRSRLTAFTSASRACASARGRSGPGSRSRARRDPAPPSACAGRGRRTMRRAHPRPERSGPRSSVRNR